MLIDKYANTLVFHTDIVQSIYEMSDNSNFPHLILNGPSGAGKNTILRHTLDALEGSMEHAVRRIKKKPYDIPSSGNKKQTITISQSKYHIVLEPIQNNYDKYIIQSVIKEYANKNRLVMEGDRNRLKFKIIVINNADTLSYTAQTSLRRTMEKYAKTARFILISTSLSKILEPIKSRCCLITVPSPTDSQILTTISYINQAEGAPLSMKKLIKITHDSNNRIKDAIWLLEQSMRGCYQRPISDIIDRIADEILNVTPDNFTDKIDLTQQIVYNLTTSTIDSTDILEMLLNSLVTKLGNKKGNEQKIIKIADIMAKYEPAMNAGRRDVLHSGNIIILILRVILEK
jgi:replication factor C subunit 3/5